MRGARMRRSAWIVVAMVALVAVGGCGRRVPQEVTLGVQQALADLPKEAKARVTTRGSTLVVSAHLLEGYPASDTDPYVKGEYWTKEALRQLIEKRSAEIYRKVFNGVAVPEDVTVRVECCHGVRVTYYGARTGTEDEAMCLYATQVRGKAAAGHDWTTLSDDGIRSLWRVTRNVIPEVQILAAP